ncbi:MAG: hypothetical protein SOX84_07455 [Prevotella sp.]|nr:hypothetical protein [Prevotella sp.]MDY4218600.1 hypothetical protein [Prevotella sp.]
MTRKGQALSLKNLTKSNVWDLQENDVFRLWSRAEREADLKDNEHRYIDIIKSAFTIEEVKVDKPEVIKKYEDRGCKVAQVRLDDNTTVKWAIKKKPIVRITDLTKDNIGHISARKLIEVLETNFGGGWESLPQHTQNIIQETFEVSTTTLPTERLKKTGGLYEKKLSEGFEVLEIIKGAWTEAIFLKEKTIENYVDEDEPSDDDLMRIQQDLDDEDDDMDDLPEDESEQDEDDAFDEDRLTEESYRTTFDANPDDLDIRPEEVADDEEF